jgi:hypothetical protein
LLLGRGFTQNRINRGDGTFMTFHQSMNRATILGAMLAAMTISNAAYATPVITPGWSGLTFDTNINAGIHSITNIAGFVTTTTSTGIGRYFSVSAGSGEFTVQVPPAGGIVRTGFAAGVISGLPSDPVGPAINHLVVFGNFTPTDLTLDFTTLFPGVSESTLINDLLTIPGSSPLPMADFNPFIADAHTLGLYGGEGASFSVVAFSADTLIGSGSIFVTPVPEPMTLAIFGAGLLGAGAIRRRKITKS